MTINPIIPIWVMAIICVAFLILKRKGKVSYIRQILIVLLLFVINLRITVVSNDVPAVTQKVDVLFVVDNTISMFAEDYNGDGRRMDAVKADCEYITEQLPGASYSVVTFGDTVQRAIPYTVDSDVVVETIGMLHGQTKYHAQGTSLNDAMGAMEEMLNDNRKNYKIIFFISDGEVVSSEALKHYKGLDAYVNGGAVLGYGTDKGGPMKTIEYTDEEPQYLYYYDDNYNEQLAISKIDEQNLKSIASDFGVDYVHMTNKNEIDNTLKNLQEKIKSLPATEDTESKEGNTDIYYLFVIPLVLLLIVDFIDLRRKRAKQI